MHGVGATNLERRIDVDLFCLFYLFGAGGEGRGGARGQGGGGGGNALIWGHSILSFQKTIENSVKLFEYFLNLSDNFSI